MAKTYRKRDQRSDFWLPEVEGRRLRKREVENWMKEVKRYNLSVIREISTRDIIYNMMVIVNNSVGYIGKLLRVDPEFSSQGKNIFLFIFWYLY